LATALKTMRIANPIRPVPARATFWLLAAFAIHDEVRAQTLDQALRSLVEAPALDGGRVGVVAIDLEDGRTLCAHDADRGFMTASNMKLVTAAVALVTLGPEFRFRTRVVAAGPLDDGVLAGDLVLVGSGDPSFGGRGDGARPEAVLDAMVDELIARHGLRRIGGDVLGDDDCQPDEIMGEGWAWNYQSDDYAAQVSGLCFAENYVLLRFTPTVDGEPPRRELVPETTFLRVVADRTRCQDGLGRSTLWAVRRRGSNDVELGGELASGDREVIRSVTVENPCAFAAWALREALRRKGITVDGDARDRDELPPRPERYGEEQVLVEHESAPLRDLLLRLCKPSQNLYGEQLIRAASRAATGNGGMRDAAAHAKLVLERLGVDPRGMRIADGSGLSRLDLVRPAQLASLCAAMWRSEHRDDFVASLPIAGVDGTLRSRFRGTVAENVVRAKTGYVQSVVALSGFVPRDPPAGPPVVFSILVNNFTSASDAAKSAVDDFVVALVRSVRSR
jgi:D-alanyl-D-alanine carboxypeptidase/D-alanyl-D-alanine-endopeptidase (penicillin-binding protein 4)